MGLREVKQSCKVAQVSTLESTECSMQPPILQMKTQIQRGEVTGPGLQNKCASGNPSSTSAELGDGVRATTVIQKASPTPEERPAGGPDFSL